jgi:mannosyltransferase OCH1-like enzyme
LIGGIYVDIDVKAIKTFDDLLKKYNTYDLIVSCLNVNEINSMIQCQHKKCLNNGVIIAKPNIEVLKILIEYVDNNNSCTDVTPKVLCIGTTTGPTAFTSVIMKYIRENKNNNILLLKPEYLEPCTLGICDPTKNTIIEHKHDGTWVPEWQYKLIKIYLQHTQLVVIILFLLIMLIIYIAYQKYNKYYK